MIPFSPGLGTSLRRLLTLLDGDVQAVYDQLGVPFRPRFYPLTALLLRVDRCSVSEIARLTNVSQPAATQTITEMRGLGLVEASPGEDKRAREVQLTAEGRRVAEELKPVWDAIGEAAAELDRQLPFPLSTIVGDAVEALLGNPFADRVRSRLERQGD